jgi:hypothetical protein
MPLFRLHIPRIPGGLFWDIFQRNEYGFGQDHECLGYSLVVTEKYPSTDLAPNIQGDLDQTKGYSQLNQTKTLSSHPGRTNHRLTSIFRPRDHSQKPEYSCVSCHGIQLDN